MKYPIPIWVLVVSCASPQVAYRFRQDVLEFQSPGAEPLRLEVKESDVRYPSVDTTWIRFPGFHGGDVYLVLSQPQGRTQVVAVGIGHGAMAPQDLPLFPEKGDEDRPWKAESPLRDAPPASMSIEWSPAETLDTGAGPIRARKVVLTYVSRERTVPVLKLWMTRDSGIVQFEHDGRLWIRSR